MQRWLRLDEAFASVALALMALIPLVEILSRPMLGKGIDNAPVLVQHLGLVMAMWGLLLQSAMGISPVWAISFLDFKALPMPLLR